MVEAPAPEPIDVTGVLEPERSALVAILSELSADEWSMPTECPAWTVHGIALHILGDDLSLLSRQRDVAQPAVFRDHVGTWAGRYQSLDDFNEHWVATADFFSPSLIVDLLRGTGDWTLAWYTRVDPNSFGEVVRLYSDDPAPYWMITAREYWERWIHHSQIRRALNRPPLDDHQFLSPAVATAVRAFPHGFRRLEAPDGTTVAVVVPGLGRWTIHRHTGSWRLHEQVPDHPSLMLEMTQQDAARLFSRAMTGAEISTAIRTSGDTPLGYLIVAGLAAALGRQPG